MENSLLASGKQIVPTLSKHRIGNGTGGVSECHMTTGAECSTTSVVPLGTRARLCVCVCVLYIAFKHIRQWDWGSPQKPSPDVKLSVQDVFCSIKQMSTASVMVRYCTACVCAYGREHFHLHDRPALRRTFVSVSACENFFSATVCRQHTYLVTYRRDIIQDADAGFAGVEFQQLMLGS